MTERDELLAAVHARLGGRPVAWFGTRGEDGLPLDALLGPVDRYSIIAGAAPADQCLEDQWGVRVDLDQYVIDTDRSPEVAAMKRRVLAHADQGGVVVSYRSSQFLDDVRAATTAPGALVLGHTNEFSSALEHKPSVERVVAALGIPTIPWQYLDGVQPGAMPRFAGPVVVRPESGSGGAGIHIVQEFDAGSVAELAPGARVAVAPYLGDAIPLNVSGVVWDGGVSVHPASVQIIGARDFTPYDLGYCGNDYSAAGTLDPAVLDQVEAIVQTFGAWLGAQGYRGAFGLDLLVDDGLVRFTECNPRFQGSTRISAELSAGIDEPCIFLDHLAACLGVPGPGVRPRLAEVAPALHGAQLIAHNTGAEPLHWPGHLTGELERRGFIESVTLASDVAIAPGGALARVTTTGSVLNPDLQTVLPGVGAVVRGAIGRCTPERETPSPVVGR